MNDSEYILKVRDLAKSFRNGSRFVETDSRIEHAISGLNIDLEKNRIHGLIGESGSGKTTLMRLILRLIEPDRGEILYHGLKLNGKLQSEQLGDFRKNVRAVFQHPDATLNPAYKISKILDQPLSLYSSHTNKERKHEIVRALNTVGLEENILSKYPHELSGGEKKRVSICRALVCRPEYIIADEPFAGLDATLQCNIRDLFLKVHEYYGLGIFLISHDVHILKTMCSKLSVISGGRIVETIEKKNDRFIFKNDESYHLTRLVDDFFL